MLQAIETEIHSLGLEPLEVLGFQTEKELEAALVPLMQEKEIEKLIAS